MSTQPNHPSPGLDWRRPAVVALVELVVEETLAPDQAATAMRAIGLGRTLTADEAERAVTDAAECHALWHRLRADPEAVWDVLAQDVLDGLPGWRLREVADEEALVQEAGFDYAVSRLAYVAPVAAVPVMTACAS
jgi:tryptophan 2,3-dioxygenase